jgi:hypothetical protein
VLVSYFIDSAGAEYQPGVIRKLRGCECNVFAA